MRIDKDLVQKAVDEAFDKIIKENESYDDSEVIYSDEPKSESKEKPEEDKVCLLYTSHSGVSSKSTRVKR